MMAYMGRYRISRKAWRTASDILLYYPDNKREYANMIDAAIAPDKPEAGSIQHSSLPDPTASAAIRLASNRRAARLKLEIEAVDVVTSELSMPELEVIRRRFWHRTRNHKPKQYDYLQDLPYSRRQMQRIVAGVVVRIAQYTGEL